ncbi:radial spoke head 10 homolog B-like isoform X3 [Pocillopora verrucosa]|uniref:radial spoke head 10 homolog B-like isoform X3 n=1 Tax=Pocillopora verrucosa TaxID=203993 RepID=UPI00333F0878
MGLCASGEPKDYEMINPYDGDTFLCFRHGEGTYHYSNGDTYDGQWRWNNLHGYGIYRHANGEVKEGHFYQHEYIGRDPGNLFAATTCCTGLCFGPAQPAPIASDEDIRIQAIEKKRERKAIEREARRHRTDEILQKHHIDFMGKQAMKEKPEQKAEEREARQRRRDEMRQKYHIKPMGYK